MAIFNLLLFLILIYSPSATPQTPTKITSIIGGIANTTRIPSPPPSSSAAAAPRSAQFKPGIAIVVAIITTLFSITFLLLLYVKHCRAGLYADTVVVGGGGLPLSRKNSGIKRKVIESLPMFRFSSLRGQKDGLECAVCLSRFEPEEVLRLLPKCKHAFHVECVDTWLDEHSTCPLCRYQVDPEDIVLLDNSKSLFNHIHGDSVTPRQQTRSNTLQVTNSDSVPTPRTSERGKGKENSISRMFSGRHSSAGERGNPLEIIVENSRNNSFDSRRKSESENRQSDLRSKSSNTWRAFRRKSGTGTSSEHAGRRDGKLPVQGEKHRLEHQIVIEEEGDAQRRWSDVQAAEILYLRTEMILGGEESGRGVIHDRSVSEITGMSRYRNDDGKREEEEGVMKRWLDWIPQSRQKPPETSTAAASSSSSSSSVV